jgi:hypothetical protein
MQRVAAVLLAVCFLGLGSGVLRFAHEAEHARQDATADATLAAGLPGMPAGHNHDGRHHHNESTCELHALLNAPLALTPVVTVLVHLGLFVAFLTLLSTPVARLRLPARINCRGPPPRRF